MGAAKLVLYGKNSYGVTMSQMEAQEYRNKFFQSYPGLVRWHNRANQDIRNNVVNGKIYTHTLSGRRRIFSADARAENGIRFTSYVNTQDQGTGGDITKVAVAKLYKAFRGTGVKPILQVHDELVLESPKEKSKWAAETLERCMLEAARHFIRSVPVTVEGGIGRSWAEAK